MRTRVFAAFVAFGMALGATLPSTFALADDPPIAPPAAPPSPRPGPSKTLPSAERNAKGEIVLRPDETLMELALRLYGAIDYWRAIQAVNPDVAVDQPLGSGAKLKLFSSKPIAPADVPAPCFHETYEFCANAKPGPGIKSCLRARASRLGDSCLDWVLPCRRFERTLCPTLSPGTELDICMRKHALDVSQECADVIERGGER